MELMKRMTEEGLEFMIAKEVTSWEDFEKKWRDIMGNKSYFISGK